MKHPFYKYQGTGNDFILIDNRQNNFIKSDYKKIEKLCDRRFGIGADGLILLEEHEHYDFKMVYYNSDGKESSMCGNGGRCMTHFANFLGLIKNRASFEAIDGIHHAIIEDDIVKLNIQNVTDVELIKDDIILNTGSPHFVRLAENIAEINVDEKGAEIRYSETFLKEGINVNFVEKSDDHSFSIRTYERGVEAETLSCGTGVVAIALAMNYIGETEKNMITVHTKGGTLQVSYGKNGSGYQDIWLIGPAKQVFNGEIEW